jgi:transcriptional regulator with XRE-family HTH domain
MIMTEETRAHPVDLHVGQRIRRARKDRHMSQGDLATALGITFQQVQKYERGANRISASKLYDAARALEVTIPYFFEGLPEDGVHEAKDRDLRAFAGTDVGHELLKVAMVISTPLLRSFVATMKAATGAPGQ